MPEHCCRSVHPCGHGVPATLHSLFRKGLRWVLRSQICGKSSPQLTRLYVQVLDTAGTLRGLAESRPWRSEPIFWCRKDQQHKGSTGRLADQLTPRRVLGTPNATLANICNEIQLYVSPAAKCNFHATNPFKIFLFIYVGFALCYKWTNRNGLQKQFNSFPLIVKNVFLISCKVTILETFLKQWFWSDFVATWTGFP